MITLFLSTTIFTFFLNYKITGKNYKFNSIYERTATDNTKNNKWFVYRKESLTNIYQILVTFNYRDNYNTPNDNVQLFAN